MELMKDRLKVITLGKLMEMRRDSSMEMMCEQRMELMKDRLKVIS